MFPRGQVAHRDPDLPGQMAGKGESLPTQKVALSDMVSSYITMPQSGLLIELPLRG